MRSPDAVGVPGADASSLVLRPPAGPSAPSAPATPILPASHIRKFESDVLRRQAERTERISDLEGRLATFHARLATECADRGREHALTAEEYVHAPLERAARRCLERVDVELVRPVMDPRGAEAGRAGGGAIDECDARRDRDGEADHTDRGRDPTALEDLADGVATAPASARSLPNLVFIERRTNLLEAQMNHHKHATLYQARRRNFDSVDRTCRQTLQPALALEMTKADKREGGMVRRFETSAGEHARAVSEMVSSRASSLGGVRNALDEWDPLRRAEHYLAEIRELKRMVVEEGEERIRQDEVVVDRIVRKKKTMQKGIYYSCP
ncbi:hypothetical protein ACHAWF_013018 [Thalassiosira exigua]